MAIYEIGWVVDHIGARDAYALCKTSASRRYSGTRPPTWRSPPTSACVLRIPAKMTAHSGHRPFEHLAPRWVECNAGWMTATDTWRISQRPQIPDSLARSRSRTGLKSAYSKSSFSRTSVEILSGSTKRTS